MSRSTLAEAARGAVVLAIMPSLTLLLARLAGIERLTLTRLAGHVSPSLGW
jgi:hypothetical protein